MFKTAEIFIDVNSVAGSNEQVAEKVQALLQDKEGKNLLFIVLAYRLKKGRKWNYSNLWSSDDWSKR